MFDPRNGNIPCINCIINPVCKIGCSKIKNLAKRGNTFFESSEYDKMFILRLSYFGSMRPFIKTDIHYWIVDEILKEKTNEICVKK